MESQILPFSPICLLDECEIGSSVVSIKRRTLTSHGNVYMAYYRPHLFWECPAPMSFTNHKGQREHYHEHKLMHIDVQEVHKENGSHI